MYYTVSDTERFVEAGSEKLAWCGRLMTAPGVRRISFPYSYVEFRFVSPFVRVVLRNIPEPGNGDENALGVLLDGDEAHQKKIVLQKNGEEEVITLADGLDGKEHTLRLFKRTGACHEVEIYGFVYAEAGQLLPPPKQPRRCIEFYGDSVTVGEVSEAVAYVGKLDPEHHGEYHNSWYSYASIAARSMNARAHLCAQGGIALLPGTGYFHAPDTVGMCDVYDRVRFNPVFGELEKWDFSRFTPHVVVVAVGQNDDFPENYMKLDPHGEKAAVWKAAYLKMVRSLRAKYPKAYIILSTTILNHAPQWDRAIGQVAVTLHSEGDDRIYHLIYSRNGRGTPGHLRIPEAEEMAIELRAFINSIGPQVWE